MLPNIDGECVGRFKGVFIENPNLCTVECTVATGFEDTAAEECKEKFGTQPYSAKGRIIFDVQIAHLPEVLKLRSIDNVNLVLHFIKDFNFNQDREECFNKLYKLAESPNWEKGLKILETVNNEEYEDAFKNRMPLVEGQYTLPRPDLDLKSMRDSTWDRLKNIPKELLPNYINEEENHLNNSEEGKEAPNICRPSQQINNVGPKFRVTCARAGDDHCFASQEAARQFGGGINESLSWPVDLKDYDVEIILNIINQFGYITFAISKEVLFKRNLVAFGRTNLKATICYNLLRMARPQVGEIIIDPMCGSGSIPIEGFLTHTKNFYLGGDLYKPSVERCPINLNHACELNKRSSLVDFNYWDCTKLPLRDQTVDVVVTDLPFGKRQGNKTDNRVLYLHSLVELARVTRVKTGRAVMLTHDRNSMTHSLKIVNKLWKNSMTRTINIGGLFAGVFSLFRTDLLFDEKISLKPMKSKGEKRPLEKSENT